MKRFVTILSLVFVTISLMTGCAAKRYFIGYVTHSNMVTMLDVATNKIIDNIYVGQNPAWIQTAPDGRHLWVTKVGDFRTSVIDGWTAEIIKTMPMRRVVFRHQSPNYYIVSSDGVYEIDASNDTAIVMQISAQLPDAWHAVLTADDRWLYVNHTFMGWMYPPGTLRRDYDYITLVDLKEKEIVKQIKVGKNPYDIKLTPNGRYIITANKTTNDISIVDTRTNEMTKSVPVGQVARCIAIRPDGKQMAVSCDGTPEGSKRRNGEIYLFKTNFSDTLIVKLQKKIVVGGFPEFGSYTPDGKKLYFIERDKNEAVLINPSALRITKRISLQGRPGSGMEIAFTEVTKEVRNSLMQTEKPTRKLLKEIIKNMKAQNPYIYDLKITERFERFDPETGEFKEQHAQKIYFKHPDLMKIETKGMKVFLFNRGVPENVRPRMPMITQRYILWAMHGMSIDEVIKYLAGAFTDIKINPRSIAVDLIHSEREGENDYYVIGAVEGVRNVSQLWVDKSTWLPYRLIEAFPQQGIVRELRFMEYKKVENKFMFPFLVEVYINGKLVNKEKVIEAKPNSGLSERDFALPQK
ncbi:MAG TPA: hypothetical protein EYP60_07070 [bacterium (Candidatus Stahlbacteria)]|nr:hypothetical protein [Candidatus Stahlbacteria bacterium]